MTILKGGILHSWSPFLQRTMFFFLFVCGLGFLYTHNFFFHCPKELLKAGIAHLLVISITLHSAFNWQMTLLKDTNSHDCCRFGSFELKEIVEEVQ